LVIAHERLDIGLQGVRGPKSNPAVPRDGDW
jgi:hypothetical protein